MASLSIPAQPCVVGQFEFVQSNVAALGTDPRYLNSATQDLGTEGSVPKTLSVAMPVQYYDPQD